MARRQTRGLLLAVCVLVLLGSSTGVRALEGYRHDAATSVHDGVTWHRFKADATAVTADVAEISPGAPVRLVPVLSNDLVHEPAGTRQTERTSTMCRRAGGVVCVNGDFPVHPKVGVPFGAFVLDGVPLRTPVDGHEQVTFTDAGITTADLELDFFLVVRHTTSNDAEGGPDGDPGQTILHVAELNRPTPSGLTIYSPAWAATTQTPADTVEYTFGGRVPRIGERTDLALRGRGGPNSPIPADGFVLSARGGMRDAAAELVAAMADATSVQLVVRANVDAVMSLGGHPVILRDGRRVAQDPGDSKITNRHPRTLLGWNPKGQIFLVAVDGRRGGHSVGHTIAEAAEFLEFLGATDGINLDGGGSTTFVTTARCKTGSYCVQNQPSDGSERFVSSALAVVPVAAASTAPEAEPAAVQASAEPRREPTAPTTTPSTTAPSTPTTTAVPTPSSTPPTSRPATTTAPPSPTTTVTTTTVTTLATTSTTAPTSTLPSPSPSPSPPTAPAPPAAGEEVALEAEPAGGGARSDAATLTAVLAIGAVAYGQRRYRRQYVASDPDRI